MQIKYLCKIIPPCNILADYEINKTCFSLNTLFTYETYTVYLFGFHRDRLRSGSNCLSHAHCSLVTSRFCRDDLPQSYDLNRSETEKALVSHLDSDNHDIGSSDVVSSTMNNSILWCNYIAFMTNVESTDRYFMLPLIPLSVFKTIKDVFIFHIQLSLFLVSVGMWWVFPCLLTFVLSLRYYVEGHSHGNYYF